MRLYNHGNYTNLSLQVKKKIKKLRGYREFQSVLLHVYLDLIQVLSIFRVFEDDGINFY